MAKDDGVKNTEDRKLLKEQAERERTVRERELDDVKVALCSTPEGRRLMHRLVVLTGVFATTAINSLSEGANVGAQALGLLWTIVYSAVGTLIILFVGKFTTGLRVSEAEEAAGLDTSLHGEALEH